MKYINGCDAVYEPSVWQARPNPSVPRYATMNEEMSSDQLRRELRTIEEMNHGVNPKAMSFPGKIGTPGDKLAKTRGVDGSRVPK